MKDLAKKNKPDLQRKPPGIFSTGGKAEGIPHLAKVIIVLFALGMLMVVQSIQYARLEEEIRILALQKRNLENEVLPLEVAEQRLINLDDVERLSQSKLGMVFPNPDTITKIIIQPE